MFVEREMASPRGPLEENIRAGLLAILQRAATRVNPRIVQILEEHVQKERSLGRKRTLETMVQNIKLAEETRAPVCQDTGVPMFFLTVGRHFRHAINWEVVIPEVVTRATREIPLRPNAVHPWTNHNTGTNVGEHFPPLYYEFNEGEDVSVEVLLKGGGAENYCRLAMLNPAQAWDVIEEEVSRTVREAGGRACPPLVVGLGIGGDATTAMVLAKRSLLRAFKPRPKSGEVTDLERRLLAKLNALNIGPMGLGGSPTVLDVCVEFAHRHPASFPVGIVLQCYLHRTAKLTITNAGEISIE